MMCFCELEFTGNFTNLCFVNSIKFYLQSSATTKKSFSEIVSINLFSVLRVGNMQKNERPGSSGE